MADLLESANDGDGDVAVTLPATGSSPPPAFPPPTLQDADDARRLKILAVIAALALAAALAMGLLWMSAVSSTNDAESARDRALADARAATDRATALSDELATARADLTAAELAQETLTAERDDALAANGDDATAAADARAEVDELTVDNERLAEEITALQAELQAERQAAQDAADQAADAGTEAPADTDGSADTEEPADAQVAEFDIEANPDFARFIGETLSSRNGASRLNQTQSVCFGTTLVDDIGLDALGRGLTLAATADDNNTVVGAMQRAAGSCNIDLGLIF